MKRVAFAWVTEWIDFTDKDEAIRFALCSRQKGHRVLNADNKYAYEYNEICDAVYENSQDEYRYTVKIEKPYRNYEMG